MAKPYSRNGTSVRLHATIVTAIMVRFLPVYNRFRKCAEHVTH
ncbi:MAG: hypothetical protein AABZ41_09910 [Bacteroidota bacterium]